MIRLNNGMREKYADRIAFVLVTVALAMAAMGSAGSAELNFNFEQPTYTLGDLIGQDGWNEYWTGGPASVNVEGTDTILGTEGNTQVDVAQSEGVESGMLGGHPYLGNEKIICMWAEPTNGAGLISIYDRTSGKELMRVDPYATAWWRVDAKGSGGQTTAYENMGLPCTVTSGADGGIGSLTFVWDQGIHVEVQASLAAHESLIRSRISVQSKTAGEGLLAVTFPIVKSILPFTSGGQNDEVLLTNRVGDTWPSPLVSGNSLDTNYPEGMQFTAMMGDGRGLYFAEEDPSAARKQLTWTPAADMQTLTLSVAHPVLNWGAGTPVTTYELAGDAVMALFQGDWFDASQIYRKWAITAPWCAKGPIIARADYPGWLRDSAFWSIGALENETGIQRELDKHDFFGLPVHICHDYWYMPDLYQHDRSPDYFPPKLGSANYTAVVQDLHAGGIRVVPYVNGWLWNMTQESYVLEDVEHNGALINSGGSVLWTYAGSPEPLAAMCPATTQWRNKLTYVAKELVQRYGVDGVYFDYFTVHTNDCYNTSHGHAICGGNFWTAAVHGLYEQVRSEIKAIDPQVMLCGEDQSEFCIDVLDSFYQGGPDSNAPVFMAVYHEYTGLFGGGINKDKPIWIGRWWLLGAQNGETNLELYFAQHPNDAISKYYKKLLKCRHEFGRPYLGYGRMLRQPVVEGNMPMITEQGGYKSYTVKAVEGTAWLASDGTVGIFFLNYGPAAYDFQWTVDLNEIAGLGASRTIKVSSWSEQGVVETGQTQGGIVTMNATIPSNDMIALRLEAIQ